MKQHRVIPGYVWCSKHCTLHRDELNPYNYFGEQYHCIEANHREVYALMDEDEEF